MSVRTRLLWSRWVVGGRFSGAGERVEEGGGPGPVGVEVEVVAGGGDGGGDVKESVADGLGCCSA
jgi:hypothetical protein